MHLMPDCRASMAGVIVSVAAVLLCGCKDTAPRDPSGPRATVVTAHRALLEGDKSTHLACFTGSAKGLRAVERLFDYYRASFALRRAVVGAYGDDGWKSFQAQGGNRPLLALPPEDDEYIRRLKVERRGDKAWWRMSPSWDIRLVLEDGKWLIRADDRMRGAARGRDINRIAAVQERAAAALRQAAAKVGQSGVDPATLGLELAEALRKARRGE